MKDNDMEPGGCHQKYDKTDSACGRCQGASRCAKATTEKRKMEKSLDALGLTVKTSIRQLIDDLGDRYVVLSYQSNKALSCVFKEGRSSRVQVMVSKKTKRAGIASHKMKGVVEFQKDFNVDELVAKL